jgi:hypothetical protein
VKGLCGGFWVSPRESEGFRDGECVLRGSLDTDWFLSA